jgi:hypothetical protein
MASARYQVFFPLIKKVGFYQKIKAIEELPYSHRALWRRIDRDSHVAKHTP